MELYRIFKPVLCISRVFFLTPFTAVEESGSTKCNFSTFWLIYSILGVCASFIWQTNAFLITLSVSDAAVFNAMYKLNLATAFVTTIVTQVLCLNNGKNVIRILDHVSLLDSEHIGARISYYRLYKVFIVHLTYSIISLVVPNAMWYAALDSNSVHIFTIVFYATMHFVCGIVLLLSGAQFIHFILCRRSAVDRRLRPSGHWGWLSICMRCVCLCVCVCVCVCVCHELRV
jgi:hypothetical protein